MKFFSSRATVFAIGTGLCAGAVLAGGCSKPRDSWSQEASLDPAEQTHRDQAAALSEEDAQDIEALHRKPRKPPARALDRDQRQHVIDQPRIP